MNLLQPKLNLRLGQRQVLTPGLMQMVSVLALNKLELREMINAEIVENPVLEEVDECVPLIDDLAAREGDRERSAEEVAADPEREKKDPFDEIDFGSYFQDYLDPGFKTANNYEDSDKPSFENFLTQPGTLTDHLLWQLGSLSLVDNVCRAAEYIIGNLNEDGYLTFSDEDLLEGFLRELPGQFPTGRDGEDGISLHGVTASASELAAVRNQDAVMGPDEARLALSAALEVVRNLDPLGIATRDLRECLLVQIKADAAHERSRAREVHPETQHRAGNSGARDHSIAALPAASHGDEAAHGDELAKLLTSLEANLDEAHREDATLADANVHPETHDDPDRHNDPGRHDYSLDDEPDAPFHAPVATRPQRAAGVPRIAPLDSDDQLHASIATDAMTGDRAPRLQLLETAERVVDRHLALLQKKDLRELARAAGRTTEQVQTAFEYIRTLDPRPGQRYNNSAARLISPDVAFVKRDDDYVVVMNEEELPTLRLNHHYRKMLTEQGAQRDVKDYVKERYRSAIQLLRNIEQRKNTIMRTCEAIIRRQRDFLERGVDALRPMMIKDVAEEIGVHPSTVSRAVSNKYVHTSQGVFELRFFFSEGVNGPEGAGTSLMLLKRKVKKLIEDEDARKPLTDDHIAAMLQSQGINVTRRTVAKYREDLHIPSTHHRRVRD